MNQKTESLVKEEWLSEQEYRDKPLFKSPKENLDYIQKILGDSFDLIVREIILENKHQKLTIGVAVMDGLSDKIFVNQIILENITKRFSLLDEKKNKKEMLHYFEYTLLSLACAVLEQTYGQLINHLLNGDTILIVGETGEFFALNSKGHKERSIEEPTNETNVKGSKESFTESLGTNVSLIRRRMRNPNLWIKKLIIGKKTNCNIAIAYIKGLADIELIETIEKRLKNEEIDSVVDSSFLKYYLREKQPTIFPLIYDTERPDSVIGNLNEGRFAILVDGSPFVLIAPCTFFHFFSSVEDYYNNSFVGSSFRIMRLLALLIAILLPGLYICIIKFNPELLPINLLYSVVGQRTNVPLPADLEVILTLFAFDLLTEAGTRMPKQVGTALSFVGAIVIGQAAVEANLISSMMLIVVAINGIGTLTIPDYDMSLTIKFLRYFILIFSLAFGLLGFAISSFVLFIHLVSLRSFGKPYMQPIAPLSGAGLMDSIIVAPLGKLLNRKKKEREKANEEN